jgi:cell division protein FtsW (lipid II flippase)
MNLGLFPVTGITLPLVSSGGTSIITTLTAIGIATNLASRRESAFAIEIS